MSSSTLDSDSALAASAQSLCDPQLTPRKLSLEQTPASRDSVRDAVSVATDGAGKREAQPRTGNLSIVSEELGGLKFFSPRKLLYEGVRKLDLLRDVSYFY